MSLRPPRVSHTVPSQPPDWAALLAVVPGGEPALEAAARAQGALARRRQIRSASDLLRLVLAYAVTGWSLRFTAAWAEVVGLGLLSEAALRRRFRQVQPWLAQMVAACLLEGAAGPRARVRVLDATTVCRPGATTATWRVHLSLTVSPLPRLDAVEVTDARGGETLRRFLPFGPGEVVLADRGYCHPPALAAVAAGRTALVVRYAWQSLPLRAASGQPFDLTRWLAGLPPEGVAEVPVVGASRAAPPVGGLRLVALALPTEVASQARARLRRRGRRKGRTPSAKSLMVAGYVVLLTTLDPEQWDAREVLRLYRVRWQVELAFKRLKGLWHLGTLRARTATTGQVTLLGRLLGAVLAERLAHPLGVPRVDWFAALERPVSLWRWGALWRQVLQHAVTGTLSLRAVTSVLADLQRHLCDSPRRRPQQAAAARRLLATRPPALAPPLVAAT